MSFTRKWLPAVAIHRLGVVEIAPSTHHCFRTAHPCAQSVKSWEASSSICVKVVVELQILESGRAHFYCGPCQSAKMNQLMSHVQKGKGSFYIAQYPVRWTAQSASHFLPSLADLFIPTPFSASPGSILVTQQLRATTKSLTFPPLSIARYSFIQLSQQGCQWRERKCPNFETVAKRDSNPGSLDCESGILPLNYRAPCHVIGNKWSYDYTVVTVPVGVPCSLDTSRH